MSGFIVKQPNGLYCRFSTTVDCPTHWNMTKEEYVNMIMEKAKAEAEEILEKYLKPFEALNEWFIPNNMTQEEFDKLLKEMSKMP
ncbi:MAG TPA: hypothetical protein VEF53_18685 [Patescibacteria group bacterium]|nr:hypothetical protein [Patescibacteria group bacterium]